MRTDEQMIDFSKKNPDDYKNLMSEELKDCINKYPSLHDNYTKLLVMIVEKLEGLEGQLKELNENLEKEAELDR